MPLRRLKHRQPLPKRRGELPTAHSLYGLLQDGLVPDRRLQQLQPGTERTRNLPRLHPSHRYLQLPRALSCLYLTHDDVVSIQMFTESDL